MLLEGGIIGFILGKVRKGRFSNLAHVSLRAWPLIFIAFFIQISPALFQRFSFLSYVQTYTYGLSIMILVGLLVLNLDKKGSKVLLIGLVLNLLVILLNGWRMPISIEGLRLAGMEDLIEAIVSGRVTNFMALETTGNWSQYLAKFIVIPKPYPLSKVISIGDLFITLGLILFIYGEMTKNHLHSRSRMIKFGYKGTI
ncbi:MAG: DUF5317 family protein [Thermotaleaceae bacterium]